jgi:hypothetical protein
MKNLIVFWKFFLCLFLSFLVSCDSIDNPEEINNMADDNLSRIKVEDGILVFENKESLEFNVLNIEDESYSERIISDLRKTYDKGFTPLFL